MRTKLLYSSMTIDRAKFSCSQQKKNEVLACPQSYYGTNHQVYSLLYLFILSVSAAHIQYDLQYYKAIAGF